MQVESIEPAQQAQRFGVQRLQPRMADRVFALELADQKLRVRANLDFPVTEIARVLQPEEEALVLRHVVARAAQVAVERGDLFARRRRDIDAESGLAGVAPAGPVDVEVEVLLRGAQGSATTVGGGAS